MPRGGSRPGAGRPKKPGSLPGVNVAAKSVALPPDELIAAIEALGSGFTSLDLLQLVYRHPSAPLDARFMAAVKALPFEHARIQTPKLGDGAGGVQFNFIRHERKNVDPT